MLAWIGYHYLWFVFKTTQWDYVGFEHAKNLINANQSFLVCFWHGRLAMMPFAWVWDKPLHMLLSEHGDGKLISRLIQHRKINSIYGSSTRGGVKAAIEAVRVLKNGHCIGITPDGPKGPRHHVADGVIHIARLAKSPIIPVSYALTRRRFLKTWDNFLFPLPFSKGVYIIGAPIMANNTQDDAEFLLCKELIKEALLETETTADQLTTKPLTTHFGSH